MSDGLLYIYEMDSTTLASLTQAVVAKSLEAGAFIRAQLGKVQSGDIEEKDRNSLVSYVDKRAEQLLVEGLSDLVPEAGFVTEEDTIENIRGEYTWVIDPLDGTTNFLQQIPIFSVSVALAHHTTPVIGCVIDVMQHQAFWAWHGGGAWLDGHPIHVSRKARFEEAIVATGFPYYAPASMVRLTDIFMQVVSNARGVRRLGSAALDLAYTACGRFDAFYETTLKSWDIAAGVLLVREAGGRVTDFNGGAEFIETEELAATNGLLHDQILKILR
jgi:myo-inositol-1(or 4)-monophosphatase